MKKVVLLTMLVPALISTLEKDATASLPYGDINGDGTVNVVDVQLMIGLSLGIPLSPILDADGDGVADQYAANMINDCGPNTILENGLCVVDANWLSTIEANAFDNGVSSVDITIDNQQAFDNGVDSVDITTDNQGVYDDGFTAGTASVDITIDNQQVFDDGVASVDITTDNQAAYDDGYTAGVASVDITTDNQQAYNDGVASVDITMDNQQAYDDGVASVDITTDNQGAYDEGYGAGQAAAQLLCAPLDAPLPTCGAENRDSFSFPQTPAGIETVTLTREGKAGEVVPIFVEAAQYGCADGGTAIGFTNFQLNGVPMVLNMGRYEAQNLAASIEFNGGFMGIESCDPANSPDSPGIARWTYLVELQEGINTFSYQREVYFNSLPQAPIDVHLSFGECTPAQGLTSCQEASVEYVDTGGVVDPASWGSHQLTWVAEKAEIVDLVFQITVEGPQDFGDGSLDVELSNILVNGIQQAVQMNSGGDPSFEVGTSNQPYWFASGLITTFLSSAIMPYSVMWKTQLTMAPGQNVVTWDLNSFSNLAGVNTQSMRMFIDQCDEVNKPLCTAQGSSDTVTIDSMGVPSAPTGSVSVEGKVGDVVELQFWIHMPDLCAENTLPFTLGLENIAFNQSTSYQFFWQEIDLMHTWSGEMSHSAVDWGSNNINGYFAIQGCGGTNGEFSSLYTTPVILQKDGLNTFDWNWYVGGNPGGSTPFEVEVKVTDCVTYEPPSNTTPPCTGLKESITFVENSVLSGGDYQLTRQGTAGEMAMVKFTATIPECGAGMHLDFDHFQLNGVNQVGTPGLVEQTNTMSNFGMTNSSWTLDPTPYLQLIACAADPTEPAVLVWEYPVVLEDGLNTLSWSYVDQDIMPFGSAPRTFDIQFGECQDTSP